MTTQEYKFKTGDTVRWHASRNVGYAYAVTKASDTGFTVRHNDASFSYKYPVKMVELAKPQVGDRIRMKESNEHFKSPTSPLISKDDVVTLDWIEVRKDVDQTLYGSKSYKKCDDGYYTFDATYFNLVDHDEPLFVRVPHKIEEKSMLNAYGFKVGDLARITVSAHSLNGKVVRVKSVDEYGLVYVSGDLSPWKGDGLEEISGLKVGDKVRIKGKHLDYARFENTIKLVEKKINDQSFQLKDAGNPGCYAPEWLELVAHDEGESVTETKPEPKAKFKVGQLVRGYDTLVYRVSWVGDRRFSVTYEGVDHDYSHDSDAYRDAGKPQKGDIVRITQDSSMMRKGDIVKIDYEAGHALGSDAFPGEDHGYYTFSDLFCQLMPSDTKVTKTKPESTYKPRLNELIRWIDGKVYKVIQADSVKFTLRVITGKASYRYGDVTKGWFKPLEKDDVRVGDRIKITYNLGHSTSPKKGSIVTLKELNGSGVGARFIIEPTGHKYHRPEFEQVAYDEPLTVDASKQSVAVDSKAGPASCSCGVVALKEQLNEITDKLAWEKNRSAGLTAERDIFKKQAETYGADNVKVRGEHILLTHEVEHLKGQLPKMVVTQPGYIEKAMPHVKSAFSSAKTWSIAALSFLWSAISWAPKKLGKFGKRQINESFVVFAFSCGLLRGLSEIFFWSFLGLTISLALVLPSVIYMCSVQWRYEDQAQKIVVKPGPTTDTLDLKERALWDKVQETRKGLQESRKNAAKTSRKWM